MSSSANVSNIPIYLSKSLENLPNEIWKPVVGYENLYQVSSYGRIKSLPRRVKCSQGKRLTNEKILSTKVSCKKVYPSIGLTDGVNRKTYKLHQVVAMAFLDFKPNGHKIVVDHIDDNKHNNNVENLQLLTPRENSIKASLTRKSKSKYVGVRKLNSGNKRFTAIARNEKGQVNLGYFYTEEEASQRYIEEIKRMGLVLDEKFIKSA